MIDALKDCAPAKSVVLSFDEKGKTPIKQFGGLRWYAEKYFIPYKQKVKALFDLFVARNLHSGERHYRFYDWKNSSIVIDFLRVAIEKSLS